MDPQAYKTPISGEIAGSVTSKQLPDIPVSRVRLKAVRGNGGDVFIGGTSDVSKPDGSNDETTGYPLDATEDTGWLFIDNLNKLYRICDNAGDDLIYFAFR